MATTVISKPEGLCFSGNLPKVKVESDAEVRVQLLAGSNTLLDETYTPDFDNLVSLDISDVIINELTFTVPNADVFLQQNIRKDFVLKINTGSYNFAAIRCGIKDFGDSAGNFLRKNFLTWQPKMKKISRDQPEYLTYHATQASYFYITAYFADGTKDDISVAAMTANNVYTVNIGNKLKSLPKPAVKAEAVVCATNSISAAKISKYQYYSIVPPARMEQNFLFENSLGGMDTVRCTGELEHSPEFTRETAVMGDIERTFFAEKSDIKTQTTDWLTRYDAAWLHDFFMSKRIYLFDNDKYNAVVIDEVTAETSSKKDLRSYEFTYRPAESSDYMMIYEKMTEYTSASYTSPVCQRIDEIITFVSAEWVSPTCQKIEQTISYTSAEWTEPTCQKFDNSVSYTSAEWTEPVCQQEEVITGIPLILELKKHPTVANTIQITWKLKYIGHLPHIFPIYVELRSNAVIQISFNSSIETIKIEFDITSAADTITQTLTGIQSFVADGTVVRTLDPDNISGVPIETVIILN
ncbi:MAG: hypothetical protein LBS69_00170 [Prevotellaceae bacterium]|jgi:hypothetical protein|nr:hypothetical protein [Prevotellaceae bacterium]